VRPRLQVMETSEVFTTSEVCLYSGQTPGQKKGDLRIIGKRVYSCVRDDRDSSRFCTFVDSLVQAGGGYCIMLTPKSAEKGMSLFSPVEETLRPRDAALLALD